MNPLTLRSVVATAALLAGASAFAAGDHGTHAGHQAAGGSSAPATTATGTTAAATAVSGELVEGEVRRIDAANKKITLKHGEIKSISMPPMTMVFQVSDPALLDKVKVGDKVRFAAEKGTGGFVVTQMQPAP